MRLPKRSVNAGLTTPERQVLLVETVACSAGHRFSLTFESVAPRWRQGIWLAVDGELVVGGQRASEVVLWRDTAPDEVELEVGSTSDGLLRLYNIWDSGRGLGPWGSQRSTSGMVREPLANGYRYRCSDINPDPSFDSLVFVLQHR